MKSGTERSGGARRATGSDAARWSLAVSLLRLPIQLVTQGIIARTLGPENFGVFGLALVVFMFAAFVSEFGFGILLMQRPEITDDDRRFAFTWQLGIGIILAALLWVSAPSIASAFDSRALEPVLRAMSAGCIVNGIACVPGILLARELRFGAMGLIDTAAYVVGYAVIGIAAALSGWGVYSMVAAWFAALLIKAAGQWMLMPLPLGLRFRPPEGVEVLRHGTTVTVTNIQNWALANVDRIAAGRLLSMTDTGGYIAAYNLSNVAFNVLLSALQPAFMSRSSQMQFNAPELRRVYRKILSALGVLLAPSFVCLAMSADDIVAIIYGQRFGNAGPVLSILFASVPIYLLWGLSTPVLWNLGKGGLEVKLQLPLLVAAIVVMGVAQYLGLPISLVSLAVCAAFLVTLRAGVIVAIVCRRLSITPRELASIAGRSGVLCIGVMLCIRLGSAMPDTLELGNGPLLHFVRCVVNAAVTGAFLACVFIWGGAIVGREAFEALDGLVPGKVRRFLPRRLVSSMTA